jgi:hypothetical protein
MGNNGWKIFWIPRSTANGTTEWEIARKSRKGNMLDIQILVQGFKDGTR